MGDWLWSNSTAFDSTFMAFEGVGDTVIWAEFNTNPKNVIDWLGMRTDFAMFKVRPKSVKSLTVLDTFISQSWKVLPLRYVSSIYPTFSKPLQRKVEYAGFINFVNILGALLNPLGRQVNWNNWFFHLKQRYFQWFVSTDDAGGLRFGKS